MARMPIASAAVRLRRVANSFGGRHAGAAPLGPVEDLAAVIDDAAAVAACGRTFAAPAQVVERARLDAEELGCLRDGEKGGIVILEHGRISRSSDG
jgi:hypothetical protein